MAIKHIIIIVISGIFLLMLSFGSSSGQPVSLPLDHWIYQYIERLELRGALPLQYYRALPMSRGETARLIELIDTEYRSGGIRLSETEASLLEKAKGELFSELHDSDMSISEREHERHLGVWSERKSRLYVDAYFREEMHAEKHDTRQTWENAYYTSGGGIIRGIIEDKVGFYVDFRNTLIKGKDILTENFSTSEGLPVAISGGNATTTQASAYLSYESSWGRIMAGREDVNWGPGYRNSLALSKNALVFDHIRLNFPF